MENNIQVKNGHIWVQQFQRIDLFGCNNDRIDIFRFNKAREWSCLGATVTENGHIWVQQ